MKKFTLIILSIGTAFLIGCKQKAEEPLNIDQNLIKFLNETKAPFYHGVASGDPTENRVILWTRVTLPTDIDKASVSWELAEDSTFSSLINKGDTITDSEQDFTVKIDATELDPGKKYYYRFKYKDIYSVIGQTKTLPEGNAPIDIAFASCSNYEWGFFNNYRFIAEDSEIDLVVHLGDYIYEYAPGVYGDTTIGRINIPAHELVTLDDYRTRYSEYRLDKNLAEAHQFKPFITTWDDHEIANNAYDEGAQNHQEDTEGNWEERKEAARKAYYEWLPIRVKPKENLYRSFKIGSLAELVILDTRLTERTEQVEATTAENYTDSTRTILGEKQFYWLVNKLEGPETWKIIGNQVPFGPLYLPDTLKQEKYMDGWDGYPFERNKLAKYLKDNRIKNTVLVTGDYHASIVLENDLEATKDTSDNVAVEFVVTSITSANDDEYGTKEQCDSVKALYYKNNPHLKYINNTDHGYLVLHVSSDRIICDYVYASTIRDLNATKRIERSFTVENGSEGVVR